MKPAPFAFPLPIGFFALTGLHLISPSRPLPSSTFAAHLPLSVPFPSADRDLGPGPRLPCPSALPLRSPLSGPAPPHVLPACGRQRRAHSARRGALRRHCGPQPPKSSRRCCPWPPQSDSRCARALPCRALRWSGRSSAPAQSGWTRCAEQWLAQSSAATRTTAPSGSDLSARRC